VAKRYDIVVIGAGSGGLVVASGASQLGAKVALVEKNKMGGECLNTGCVPSKTLIHSAKVVSLLKRAAAFGLNPVDVKFDYGKVIDHVHAVINRISRHDSVERFEGLGCDVFLEGARFESPHEIKVGNTTIQGKKFVIATGSSPLIPPFPGLRELDLLTNENIFEERKLPRSLIVLGAGPISVELAQAFHRFGSNVTIIQRSTHILSKEDVAIRIKMEEILRKEGLEIITGTAIERFEEEDGNNVVYFKKDNELQSVKAEKILCALGRVPNTTGLNLEAAGVEYNEKGIIVDHRLRTSKRHIYACGDVIGHFLFTHMAGYQAGIVIRNAIFRLPAKVDYRVVPWVTFTDPEVARVGMTEEAAKREHNNVAVYSFPFEDNDRANTEEARDGFAKIICNKKGKILGAHVIGPHSGEYLHELVVAMKYGLSIDSIMSTIHAYPTLAEVLKQTASQRLKGSLTPFKKKLIQKIFGLSG
jgi:dihydrolipoamide dehydrogenase